MESKKGEIIPIDPGTFYLGDKKEFVGTYGANTCFAVIMYNEQTGMRYISHIAKRNNPLKEVKFALDKLTINNDGKIIAAIATKQTYYDELLEKETAELRDFFQKNEKIYHFIDFIGKENSLAITPDNKIITKLSVEDFISQVNFNSSKEHKKDNYHKNNMEEEIKENTNNYDNICPDIIMSPNDPSSPSINGVQLENPNMSPQ